MSTYIWPWVKGTVASQWFGENPGGLNPSGGHTGIDGPLAAGTPVRAAGDGVIAAEGWVGNADGSDNPWWLTDGGGIKIVLDCGNSEPTFVYAHLSSTLVDGGQRVTKGDVIGYSGNTGRWTTGAHLHFEALPPGYILNSPTYGRVDPSIYCKSYWEDLSVPGAVLPQSGAVLAGFQRVTVPDSKVGFRVAPSSSAELIKWLEPDHIYDFKGFVRKDGDHWFVGRYTDGFSWRGGFLDEDTHDLPDLTEQFFPTPAPPVVVAPPAPAVPKYDFALDFATVNGHAVRKSPAAVGNFEAGNFPAVPTHIVIHQMGTPGVDTLSSTRNHFGTDGALASTNFGVGGDGAVDQFVKLGDRAYHAGSVGNAYYSIETDPRQSPATVESGRALVQLLRDRHPGADIKLITHRVIPGNSTNCGALIDLAKYEPLPLGVPPTQPPAVDEASVLRKFFDWLINMFINRDKVK